MRKYISYFKKLILHKWFVVRLCRKFKCSLSLGLARSLSKFLPSERFPYADCFFKDNGSPQYNTTEAFQIARLKYCHRNLHQYQYWIIIKDGKLTSMAMPEKYIREMLADWTDQAITKMNEKSAILYYEEHKTDIILHKETRIKLEQILAETRL